MTEICVGSVEWSHTAGGYAINIFGRDKDGNAHRVDVLGFRHYFYIPVSERAQAPPDVEIDEKEYRSIHGEPLLKIILTNPGDVFEMRDRFTHFEGDVPFTQRFLIDTGIKSGVSFPSQTCDYKDLKPVELNFPARTCILDIECTDESGFPTSDKDPILCICCYDTFDKKYTSFVITTRPIDLTPRENGCFNPEIHDVMSYNSEKELLIDFCDYMKSVDFDVITGWNSSGFDLPYIFGRMDKHGISKENLSRLKGNSPRIEVRGRQLFDLLSGYKRMHLGEQPSYRLDAIAFAELGKQKVRFAGKICDLWRNNPSDFLYYNFTDVELCVKIDEKDKTIDFHRYISQYVGCQLERTTNSMPIIDAYILRKSFGRFVLPSISQNPESSEAFEGATVFQPPVGIKKNVAVLDLKSLYPLIMMTINASPETKSPDGEIKTPNGIRFKSKPDGIVREIQSEILSQRDELKKSRNTFQFGSPEYKNLDMRQDVVKIIMNSYYGVSGNPFFRLYDRDVGAAVTSVGRAILNHNKSLLEQSGYTVVLGDTDSCGIEIPENIGHEGTIKVAKDLEIVLNNSYSKFAKDILNADTQYFSVKFEKLYLRFFSGGKKKRYAGLLIWKEGKDVHEIDIVGFETERSDSPRVTRNAMKLLMSMVLEGKEYADIKKEIREIVRKYRAKEYPLDEIGIPGGIGKELEEYARPDAQVRGALYSNKYLGTHFGKGSKPKRLYIKSVPSNYPKTDVICFEYPDEVPPGFIVDKNLMLQKNLEGPLSRILQPLGWNWTEFDPATPTLSDWF